MIVISRRKLLAAAGGSAALLAAGALPAAAARSRADAGLVVRWNQTLLRFVRTPGVHPATVHPTRSFAIMHAAMYDAVAAATGAGRPLLVRVDARRGASPVAAAALAAHDVLAALYPAKADELD